MIKRDILDNVKEDLRSKTVLLTGPRQAGKTTFSKNIYPNFEYLNYDNSAHKIKIKNNEWDREKPILIFDELHKMNKWKLFLKGVFDVEGTRPGLFVTGSSKLDVFKKVGDSLAGRFFKYRLHPFDIREVRSQLSDSPSDLLERMLLVGNFPEPFLSEKESFYRRWKKSHIDVILRQDLIDLSIIQDIPKLEHMIELLKNRVGSTISFANLARDIEKDPNTVKRWLSLLENLYVVFRVSPYSTNISRSLLKESKYYFYDVGQVKDHAARLENILACALLKKCHYLEDMEGLDCDLHFLRTKDGKEIDFLTVIDKVPTRLIELKVKDTTLAKGFNHFLPQFPNIKALQLVKDLERNFGFKNGVRVEKLAEWLCDVDIL